MKNKTTVETPVRSIRSFPDILPWLTMPFTKPTCTAYINLVRKVYANFVKIQKQEKKHKIHIPIIYIDSEIDDKIPFTPEKVDTYLKFVNYFVRPISMLVTRFGLRRAAPICAEYINLIASLYQDAGTIYKYCLTTTHRPVYKKDRRFRFIYKNDPHYLCVPSLHICIVTGCYAFFRNLFKKEHFTPQEQDLWNKELYEDAVAIGESVLFVKQHSVNCIPAALYMMTTLHGDLFTTYDSVEFINSLFAGDTTITPENRIQINSHINFMYERLLLESTCCDTWQEPVRHWLRIYAKQTNQPLDCQ
ncbi:MAG: hypothetical protein M0P01_14220 [Treponema sp.]|nr:hypothetical protein [Treponema sp.]